MKRKAQRFAIPKNDRDKLFCKRWLETFDTRRAYAEAGFRGSKGSITINAPRKLAQFMEYLRPFQEAKAREAAKILLVDQEQVLTAMSHKALFDPGDFVERSAEPLTVTVKEGKRKVTRTRLWDGKPVFGGRMKPFFDLTPEQRLTVQITGVVGEEIQYRLPNTREQHTAQIAIGRQFGMFLDKLIIERSQAKGAHRELDIKDAPTSALKQLTLDLLPFVGQEFASRLGFTLEDIEEAKKRVVSEVGPRRSG